MVIVVDLRVEPDGRLAEVLRRLDRIERLIRTEGNLIMSDIHDEIREAVAPVLAQLEALDADVARELTDFANKVAPKLTDDEKAQFAALAQRLTDLDASVNAADPAPEPVQQ